MDVKWRKSSRSDTNGGACVEVATLPAAVWVRDSKHTTGPVLAVTREQWRSFLDALK